MRGARRARLSASAGSRIIPADAGSTRTVAGDSVDDEDHPRGCGEHKCIRHSSHAWNGSSPRMRGALFETKEHHYYKGIIPADAGSTRPPPMQKTPAADHPRGCGEHPILIVIYEL